MVTVFICFAIIFMIYFNLLDIYYYCDGIDNIVSDNNNTGNNISSNDNSNNSNNSGNINNDSYKESKNGNGSG